MPNRDTTDTGDSTPVVLGVAGTPDVVARSLSPVMFAAALHAANITGFYVPLGIRERSARKALRSLARLGFRGVNVTMPFKSVAAEIADSQSDLVAMTGVANTLSVDAGGQIHADATDGIAVVEALEEQGISCKDGPIMILGAGGAAVDAAFALAHAGAREMYLVNRSLERAESLANSLQNVFPALMLEIPDRLPIQVPAHVLVSAVPEMAVTDAAMSQIASGAAVVDLAYRPDRQPTKLMQSALNRAAVCIDGREILARQGAHSFRLWFGVEAPLEVMKRAVK